MLKKLLFGTTNKAKIEYVKTIVKDLPLEILSLEDVGINLEVDEDGQSPGENALKKSRAYFSVGRVPTFSFDSGLYIDKFPEDKQPGLHVRRINGKKATDGEMLDYYTDQLDKIGGESTAKWITSIALVESDNQIYTQDFVEHTTFTSKRSSILNHGNPLNSIQIDPLFDKYISEITAEERGKVKGELDIQIYRFFTEYLKKVK